MLQKGRAQTNTKFVSWGKQKSACISHHKAVGSSASYNVYGVTNHSDLDAWHYTSPCRSWNGAHGINVMIKMLPKQGYHENL